MPVVFICDETYVMPTAVAISSIKENKGKNSKYEIYVIGLNLSKHGRDQIQSLNERNFCVKIIERELSDKQRQVVQYRERVTTAAVFKFDLPYIFEQYEKILYLDSDVIVQKDLTKLFTIDINTQYAAVVMDTMTIRGKNGHLKRIDYKENEYFNSGVLLLNLEKMRRDGIPDKLLDYRLNGKNFFMDQDALNVVFQGNVKYISPYYNLLNCFFEWQSIEDLRIFYDVEFPKSLKEIYKNAVILHFGDKKKPWEYNMGYLTQVYKKYYSKSPYTNTKLNLKNEETQNGSNSILRKLFKRFQGGISCYKENGLIYTIRRMKEHLNLLRNKCGLNK